MTSNYKCNLIIPGAAKSGTSTLHDMLSRHPDVCMSYPKEPQFFTFADRYDAGPAHHNAIFQEPVRAKYFGESSQCYFTSEIAIKRIASELDNAKVIIVLRDPVDRLISQYMWNFRRGTERDALKIAIRDRGEDTGYIFDARINRYREIGGYLAFSRYSKFVRPWIDQFGLTNTMILRFDDLVDSQSAVLEKCCEFLKLDLLDSLPAIKKNPTSSTTSVVLSPQLRRVFSHILSWLKETKTYSYFTLSILRLFTKDPSGLICEEAINEIEEILKDDIEYYRSLANLSL
jgi:hypothetical protein